jgi:hypothetical protein
VVVERLRNRLDIIFEEARNLSALAFVYLTRPLAG